MIPQKIQALFEFIDFLDDNKSEYIEKYIPLCDELNELDKRRNELDPDGNYKDRRSYDNIQKQIKEKFAPIKENIYKPITGKMRELGIWAGDDVFTSIWNNNISEISYFKRNFSEEDTIQIFQYKQKYLDFRAETNNDFHCLSFVFQSLDEILKELFNFFKDTSKNEFDSFETKIVEVEDFDEMVKRIKDNRRKNIKYSIPSEAFFGTKQIVTSTKTPGIKNEIIMGDKIEVGNISNNTGQISVGKGNKTKVNGNDELAAKSFRWQKRDTIISIVLGIIGIIIAYLSMGK
ncbi:hypothetical protein [Olivibacter domesticus]|uniref:Uncharacterized protein n=1 Tax=Olivibacter domesticus TaxID=407022 RepID=A0A1H7KJY8_OLID1|nr:hypothetical protein [Olivibacter domesticus]SEK86824.1 hypothetical protein SAMN05661044_01372 [Olivibacter domesticus]